MHPWQVMYLEHCRRQCSDTPNTRKRQAGFASRPSSDIEEVNRSPPFEQGLTGVSSASSPTGVTSFKLFRCTCLECGGVCAPMNGPCGVLVVRSSVVSLAVSPCSVPGSMSQTPPDSSGQRGQGPQSWTWTEALALGAELGGPPPRERTMRCAAAASSLSKVLLVSCRSRPPPPHCHRLQRSSPTNPERRTFGRTTRLHLRQQNSGDRTTTTRTGQGLHAPTRRLTDWGWIHEHPAAGHTLVICRQAGSHRVTVDERKPRSTAIHVPASTSSNIPDLGNCQPSPWIMTSAAECAMERRSRWIASDTRKSAERDTHTPFHRILMQNLFQKKKL